MRALLLPVFIATACRAGGDDSHSTDADILSTVPVEAADTVPWSVRPLSAAPPMFRPSAWSSDRLLWGLVRGRVTRVNVESGAVSTTQTSAWWIRAAPDVVAWKYDGIVSIARVGAPESAADLLKEADAPDDVLWSPDGSRALVSWVDEAGGRVALFERGSPREPRELRVRIPGYAFHSPALWLDSARVVFHMVAIGPLAGEPAYRESGWRGDLALLDVDTDAYDRVTSVADGVFLRVAGPHPAGILVTEWRAGRASDQALYDAARWQRRATTLPAGRAFSSRTGAVVVLLDPEPDSTTAVLYAGGKGTILGVVARDAEPVFTPDGRRGALRTATGVVVFERARP